MSFNRMNLSIVHIICPHWLNPFLVICSNPWLSLFIIFFQLKRNKTMHIYIMLICPFVQKYFSFLHTSFAVGFGLVWYLVTLIIRLIRRWHFPLICIRPAGSKSAFFYDNCGSVAHSPHSCHVNFIFIFLRKMNNDTKNTNTSSPAEYQVLALVSIVNI
jgi:hypothetical protein